jgi:hypothetical protein
VSINALSFDSSTAAPGDELNAIQFIRSLLDCHASSQLSPGVIFFAGLGLHYALPRVSVVEVVGVEVKRADAEQGICDVYMIQTQLSGGGDIRVFSNEDAWLYLKFDSATLQARVTGLSRDQKSLSSG